jgi:hypothetical protein
MTSTVQKRRKNREAQSKYRQRQKKFEALLEESIKQNEIEVQKLRDIRQQRAEKTSQQPGEAVISTIDRGQIGSRDPTTQCSEQCGDVTDVSQQPVTPRHLDSCDLSLLFPQFTTRLNSDFLINGENNIDDFALADQNVANGSDTHPPFDDLGTCPDIEVYTATSTYKDQTLENVPPKGSYSPASKEVNEICRSLGTESVGQDNKIHAPNNDSGLGFPCLESLNLPTGTPQYAPYLDPGAFQNNAEIGLTTWSGAPSLDYAFCPRQMAAQQFMYALQNLMSISNNPPGFPVPYNHFHHLYSRLQISMGVPYM